MIKEDRLGNARLYRRADPACDAGNRGRPGLKEPKGALVAEAAKDGPATEAGIKAGDTIVSVNGKSVAGPKELSREIAGQKPGSSVKLGLIRDGKEQTLSLKLGALPGDKTAKAETGDKLQEGTSFGLSLAPAKSVKGAGDKGVAIMQVDPEGAAAQQGIKAGDVILEIAGRSVTEPSEVKQALGEARKEGKKAVLMRLKSGDQSRFVALAFPKADARGLARTHRVRRKSAPSAGAACGRPDNAPFGLPFFLHRFS